MVGTGVAMLRLNVRWSTDVYDTEVMLVKEKNNKGFLKAHMIPVGRK